MMVEIFRVLLPWDLTNNNDGQQRTWHKSANHRKAFERWLRLNDLVRTPFDKPVVVKVIRVLGKGERLWDSSSVLRGNYKQMEDSFVACGWFHDDNAKWITQTVGAQDDSRREQGPAVEIRVYGEDGVQCE